MLGHNEHLGCSWAPGPGVHGINPSPNFLGSLWADMADSCGINCYVCGAQLCVIVSLPIVQHISRESFRLHVEIKIDRWWSAPESLLWLCLEATDKNLT